MCDGVLGTLAQVLDQFEKHPEMLEWSAQEWDNKLGKNKIAFRIRRLPPNSSNLFIAPR